MPREWADDNPYFLLVAEPDPERGHVIIDLGEQGWSQTYSPWMRRRGWWYLCDKVTEQPVLAMVVKDMEQPYYAKRHVGQFDFKEGRFRETACHGIGKKLIDGTTMRLWILPNGATICGGEDIEPLAMEVVKTMEWVQQEGGDGKVGPVPG